MVPKAVREERRGRLMQAQAIISQQRLQRFVGRTLKVIVDHTHARGGVGRSFADAPEIDGVVKIDLADRASRRYKAGDIIVVRITAALDHDLVGYPA